MTNLEELNRRIMNDLGVELYDEFDRNFERKAFFNEKWPEVKHPNTRGSLLMRTGNLRRSIRYIVRDDMIVFSSSLPYASIHNEGGEIVVTQKMKSFFWAMYYKAMGGSVIEGEGDAGRKKKKSDLPAEAEKWKALALLKVGDKMKILKRQIVGNNPQVAKIVKDVIDENMNRYNDELKNMFKR